MLALDKLAKDKHVTLYKAYIVSKHDEKLNLNVDNDTYSASVDEAIRFLFNTSVSYTEDPKFKNKIMLVVLSIKIPVKKFPNIELDPEGTITLGILDKNPEYSVSDFKFTELQLMPIDGSTYSEPIKYKIEKMN